MSNGAGNFYKSRNVVARPVTFPTQYKTDVAANLFVSRNLAANAKRPAIIVGHPTGALKEQSASLYAQKMADRGYVAVSLDLPFGGGSEGQPRNGVSPDFYAGAFSATVDFLGAQPQVDRERIGVLGICGSGSFVISAAKIDPRMKAVVTVSMYDMGAASRQGLRKGVSVEQRKQFIEAAARQRWAEAAGGETQYISGTVHELTASSTPIEREFYGFYRMPRGEFTPTGGSPHLTTHPTLASSVKCMNFHPLSNIETISPARCSSSRVTSRTLGSSARTHSASQRSRRSWSSFPALDTSISMTA
jgi:fermentation-respiration switch protein FrsA (DUF1100 family)